jgi:cold-inducible RNA-binding protein
MAKLYVGNLPAEVTNDGLQALFSSKGFQVTSARVICDREGGRSRGFGFVEVGSQEDAERAIGELHGSDVDGRTLQVNEARPQESRVGGDRSAGGHGHSGERSGGRSRRQ